MKHYKPTKHKGMYQVIDDGTLKYGVGALRPTKNSAGMAYTAARSGHNHQNPEINTLNVRGTLDKIGQKLRMKIEKAPCGSCGCKCRGKSVLKGK